MTNPETAVTVIEQPADAGMVEWNLDNWPVDQFNRLLPTQTASIPTDLLRPVVQVVQLNPDADKGGDIYHSNDMPSGQAAPTKVGLRKLATAAGISIVDERRTDDGTDPEVIEVTCLAEMLLPTGQRITATGTKRVDLNAQTWASDAHRKRFKSYFLEHVASRAQNRAIRALLSLRGSYPTEVYRRPFAVVSYAPNMAHPEIRQRFLEGVAPATSQLYGPTKSAPKQIGSGPAVVEAPTAPEDDAAPTPTELPGERLARAQADEPEWLRDEVAPKAKAAAKKPDFLTQLRDSADALEGGDEAATAEDLAPLRDVFAGWGGLAAPGFGVVWNEDGSKPSKGQAHAIATVHDSLGHDAFEREWRALVDKSAKAVA